MRVALIHPSSPFLVDAGVHPPLGLWYLGASLKQHGHDVTYVDRGLGDPLPRDCDVWALTGTTPQLPDMAQVLNAAGDTPVIVGGPHATLDPEGMLALGATTVICGEGEYVLPGLLDGEYGAAKVVDAKRIADLDALPFPDRSQAGRYHYEVAGIPATTAITSRGCPHKCAFCSHGIWQQRYTTRSAENVIAEAREIRDMGYRAVQYFDDSLAIDRTRLLAICAGLGEVGMTWRAFVRADQMSREVMLAMADGGCAEIGLGVESGSQKILDAINKGESVQQQGWAIHWARAAGIRVKAFIIVGLPGETWQTIDETAAFLAALEPDDVDITVLQIMPGAPIADDPAHYGLTPAGGPGWYKGRRGEYEAHHRTAGMSADDLLLARDYLEARFKPRKVAA